MDFYNPPVILHELPLTPTTLHFVINMILPLGGAWPLIHHLNFLFLFLLFSFVIFAISFSPIALMQKYLKGEKIKSENQ